MGDRPRSRPRRAACQLARPLWPFWALTNDPQPGCTAMASYVRRAAAITSAKVTLLYVLEPSTSPTSGFELLARPLSEVEKDRECVARAKLDSYLPSEFSLDDSPRLLVAGEAAAQVAEVARERGFDLIVMPTHAGAFRRMLLGSATAKALNDADCPVLTTQHAETISPRRTEQREWVCVIGLITDSTRVLRCASQLAEILPCEPLTHSCDSGRRATPTRSIAPRRARAVYGKAGSPRPRPRAAKGRGLACSG